MKKTKKEPVLNWQNLSFVAYASGIEVYHASLFFRDKKNIQKKILDQALDEYRHSRYCYNLAKKNQAMEGISSPTGLINIGGLSRSPFPTKKNEEVLFLSYLYVGKLRAIAFRNRVTKSVSQREVSEVFEVINRDEKNHADGLMRYLSTKNKILVGLSVVWNKLKFAVADMNNAGFISKLRIKIEGFLIKKIFTIFPDSIFETKDSNKNFREAYEARNRLS
jgi:rubrerythrin